MCGRTTLAQPNAEIARIFRLNEVPELELRYNIAPTQPIAVVRNDRGTRRLDLVTWGLIPASSSDPRANAKLINARVETVATKRPFAEAFRGRRCLVVVDGFYEWQRQGKSKQAHHMHLPGGRPFGLAGLWDRWTSKSGEVIESCTIITRESVGGVRELHDRMPVILEEADHDAWLDPALVSPAAIDLLLKKPPPTLIVQPVSSFVNSAVNEGPACLLPHGGTNLSLF